jgi:crossover junction endodeoxyribonuclease RuvC
VIYLGIDPGLNGGIAALSSEGDFVSAATMPVIEGKKRLIDVRMLKKTFEEIHDGESGPIGIVVIENVHSMPREGVSSAFSFGRGLGMLEGVCAGMGLPYVLVTPQEWKKHVLAGTAKDKAAAISYCERRWPNAELKATPRCRKPHDGIADALLLCEYARRMR